MPSPYITRGDTTPLVLLSKSEFKEWLKQQPKTQRQWLKTTGFNAAPGTFELLPDRFNRLKAVLVGRKPDSALWQLASLAVKLPKGSYHLESEVDDADAVQMHLGWGLAAYRFGRYKKNPTPAAKLLLPAPIRARVKQLLAAQSLVRDLVNTPTEDLGPQDLAGETATVAEQHQADFDLIQGDDLLHQNYPAIHAVGRACDRPPCLAHLSWGDASHPRVALVGKGVCFDTGGLDIKSAIGMLKMKKDMGGAAHVLGLAQLIMQHKLPVKLDLLVPAVENSIAGNAYRPGDVINTRKGMTVEIGNTDAEGRIVLSDSLVRAAEEQAEIIIDFATLTGAARVALGPDLPALFCNQDAVAAAICQAGLEVEDPLWTLPLYQPYNSMLKSKIADLNNVGRGGFGGAITAALFLQHFVPQDTCWVHIDTYAWNDSDRPGRPSGGEALGMRAVFRYLQRRYAGD